MCLFKIAAFSFGVVFSLTLLTGNLIISPIALWSVCALAIGTLVLSAIWRLRISMLATHYDASDVEVTQLLIEPIRSKFGPRNVEPESIVCSVTCRLNDAPSYCTPLEILNRLSSEIGTLHDHEIQATFATFVAGPDGNCAFITSPCTTPPTYTIQIFVYKEETIVYDVAAYNPSGTPSSLILSPDLPHIPDRDLTELIKYCEAAIMESNMREMELL
ncbi:unnamed protein product [Rhizoctonia solani]|uniref:Uncharacterized protein n=1 Tax=Rhizoctonia solani TaxID=456999 RepID=A0A8H2XH57_9AGAM|nr:unnamed protein product [Rhizoctonia solani]